MIELVRLTARLQLTRARLLGLAGFGALGILIALAVRLDASADGESAYMAGRDTLDAFGLALYVPLCALALASAALGDLVEDNTLVYVWLRPVARVRIALSALVSTLGICLPLTMIPMAVMAGLTGDAKLVAAAVASAAVGSLAYGSLFVALGLRVRRSLVWGLAYVMIWEGAVARVAKGAARISVQVYARSVLNFIADAEPPTNGVAPGTAVMAVALIMAVAAAITTRWLKRLEVA